MLERQTTIGDRATLDRAPMGLLLPAVPIAALLVFAAALKLAPHGTTSLCTWLGAPSSWFEADAPPLHAPAVLTAVSILEILFAGVLIVYVRQSVLWILTAILFAGFAGYTAVLWGKGMPTCGCYGALNIHPSISFTIDVVFAVVALGCAALASQSPRIVGYAVNAMGCAAVFGAGVAYVAVAKPAAVQLQDGDPIHNTMQHPDLHDLLGREPGTKPTLVFIYSPKCPYCKEYLAALDLFVETQGATAMFDVRAIPWTRFEVDPHSDDATAVWATPWHAWPQSHNAYLVGGSEITRAWHETMPNLIELNSELGRAMEHSKTEPLERMRRLPQMHDIVSLRASRPAWLVVVYNPGCPACADKVRNLNEFTKHFNDDDTLRVRMFSMIEMHRRSIPTFAWKNGSINAFLYENGLVTQTWHGMDAETGVPNPYDLWGDLSE